MAGPGAVPEDRHADQEIRSEMGGGRSKLYTDDFNSSDLHNTTGALIFWWPVVSPWRRTGPAGEAGPERQAAPARLAGDPERTRPRQRESRAAGAGRDLLAGPAVNPAVPERIPTNRTRRGGLL